MMDLVDTFELAHGTYPIAFDRRWHCGVHLMPTMQNEKVRAIADGDVVAYRVCQKPYDGGDGRRDSHAGFVLLKHTTETGEGRTLTFYSLYMHLLDLDSYGSMNADGRQLPEFLRLPSPGGDQEPAPAQSGGNLKVRRKDVLGWIGGCHGQQHLHFEIFMTKSDHDACFGRTQLGSLTASTATGSDCWGHNYFVIPAGRSFLRLPTGADSHGKLRGIVFTALDAGSNVEPLFVEIYFHKGDKYTNVWKIASDGRRTLLTSSPVKERDYEYDMYKRATALYPACASDGYELLRFGRILSPSPTLRTPAECSTWIRMTFAAGQEGYIDVSDSAIVKLSLDELTQLLPRRYGLNRAGATLSWETARGRLNGGTISHTDLCNAFRKYQFSTAERQVAFLSQAYIETGLMRTAREDGQGRGTSGNVQYYQAFYGRGLMQLTWPTLYDDYGKFRAFAPNTSGQYTDRRITQTSNHYWSGAPTVDSQGHTHRDTRRWYPRYDPELLVSIGSNACDSAGFFWVWKHFMGTTNILRIADAGITTETVGRMSILVNGGGNGYDDRQQYAAYLLRYRGDTTDTSTSATLTYARQKIVSRPRQTPTWGQSATISQVYVDFTPQRPA